MDSSDDPSPSLHDYVLNFFVDLISPLFKLSILLVLVSQIFWVAIAFYCLKKYNERYYNDLMRFAYVTFFLSALSSSMGIVEIIHENVMSSMRALLELLQASLALPCLTTEVWLKYNVAQKEVAWLHTIIGLIPTYIFLFQHYTRQDLIDFTVVMNIVSLMGVGMLYRDIYAMIGSTLIFLAYCIFFFRNEMSYEPMSRQLFNYCMGSFTFCAYKAVID